MPSLEYNKDAIYQYTVVISSEISSSEGVPRLTNELPSSDSLIRQVYPYENYSYPFGIFLVILTSKTFKC